MATLREQLALKRQELDAQKRLLADSQVREQELTAEKTAYLEYEERLRQELAGVENELLVVGSETTTSQANVDKLLQERTAWDPEYLAQLDSVNLPPGRQSSAVSKATTNSSAPGPVFPAVSRPAPGFPVDDTSAEDASSASSRPDPGPSDFAGSFDPPENPAAEDNVDAISEYFGAGNFFDDSYGGLDQDYTYFQNDDDDYYGNEDSGIGLDQSLSGMNAPGNAVVATPAFGAPLQARTWDPKYLAASANAEDFVMPMPSGLELDNTGLIVRDYTRTDPIFAYGLSERRALYRYGWNPDTLDNDIFPPHSDEAHLMKAVAAAKDDTLAYLARGQELASASEYGDTKDCCPQNLLGLERRKSISYRCPHTGCETARHQWTFPLYRLAALCRLERSEYWKISLPKTPETTSGSTAFDASAECCVYQGENHCVTHVHMETKHYNHAARMPHHNGRQSCHCPIPCVGKCVTHFWTERDYQMLDALTGSKLDRPICELDGCDIRTTPTDGQPNYCVQHSQACKTEGCLGRCRTGRSSCDECRANKTDCQFDGCKTKFTPTDEQPDYCARHFHPCETEGCHGRCRNDTANCDKCRVVRCQLDGCTAKTMLVDGQPTQYCGAHIMICKNEGCDRYCRRPNHRTCEECLAARVVCQFEGCENKFTATIRQPTHCTAHSTICKIEGCNQYCKRPNDRTCEECLASRVDCQLDGCKVKFMPNGQPYCNKHVRACKTDGCPGRTKKQSASCNECVLVNAANNTAKGKGKRKKGSDVVGEDENEEGNGAEDLEEPPSKRARV